MTQNQGDAKELWNEALEEDSAPAFELKTFEQFVNFIKVGITALLEHKKLEKIEDISDSQKELIADIGLFMSLYGSYNKWKDERKTLKSQLAHTLNQLKKISVEHKLTSEIKSEIENRYEKLEHTQTEAEIRKKELEKNNEKLQSEIDKLNLRIIEQHKQMIELSQGDVGGLTTMNTEQIEQLRNARVNYELELFEKKSEIEILMLEIEAIDKQRTRMDEILVEYKEFLDSMNEFNERYDTFMTAHEELDKKRLFLETKKNSEQEKIEDITAEIESRQSDERKIQDELRKFDLEIEKISIEKAENHRQYEQSAGDIERYKEKIQEVIDEKGNMDEVVSKLRTKSNNLSSGVTQIQNLLRLKINEATQLQARIDDPLTSTKQVSILTETLQDVRSQIEQVKSQVKEKEAEKSEVDKQLAELAKSHNAHETKISEIRRKIDDATSMMNSMQDEIRNSDLRVDAIELEKKTVIAGNQDLLDELESLTKRKQEIENKISDIDKEIAEAVKMVDESDKALVDLETEKIEFLEKKYEFENRIIGYEKLYSADDDQSEEAAPSPFGAGWVDETEGENSRAKKIDQFENYKNLSSLRFELSSILPSKLELEFKVNEIEEDLINIESELMRLYEEKENYESESAEKNDLFDLDIRNMKQRTKELSDEIATNQLKKIEMLKNKEKLYASFTTGPDNDGSEENPVLEMKRNEIKELEDDIFKAGEQIERLETFKSEMQDKLDEKVSEKTDYNAQFDILTKRCSKLEDLKKLFESELEQARPKVTEMNTKFNKTKSMISETSVEYYALTTEYERLIHQRRNQEEEVALIEFEFEKFEKDLRKLTEEKEEIRRIKEGAINDEDGLSEELRNMKTRVGVTEDDVNEVKEKLEHAEARVEKYDSQYKEIWQKIQEAERIVEQYKERKKKIFSGRDDLEKRVNSIEALMKTKENLMSIIRAEIEQKHEHINTLKSERNLLTVQFENSVQQRKEVETINEELHEKIKHFKDKYDKLYDDYINRDTVTKDLKVKYPIIEQELEKSRYTEKEALTKLMRIEDQYSRSSDKTKGLELIKVALTKDINQLKQELENTRLECSNIEAENAEINAQYQKRELKISELEKELKYYQEMEKKFEALKKRNEYLEAEMKKFSSLMGFEDIDITTELKQKLINSATMNLSARFLQKGWDYKNTLPKPDEITALQDVSDALNVLSKPLDAMKLRLNLRKFFETIKDEIPKKMADYRTYFDKRTDEKPLTNGELKEVYSIASHYVTLKEVLDELLKNLKISVP